MNVLKILLIIVALNSTAQAQWIDEQGYVDYGYVHKAISGGEEVPASRKVLTNATVYINTIFNVDGQDKISRCSGTVIAQDAILTAAHCLNLEGIPKASDIKVLIGNKSYTARSYVAHELHYTNDSTWRKDKVPRLVLNDIGIIFLKKDLPPSSIPVLLPPPGEQLEYMTEVIIAGYGRISNENKESRGVLRWGKIYLKPGEDLTYSFYGPVSFCIGDSGGPALIQKGERYVLAGVLITSDCKDSGDIVMASEYTNWIMEKLEIEQAKKDI